jgi:hypothetical protein
MGWSWQQIARAVRISVAAARRTCGIPSISASANPARSEQWDVFFKLTEERYRHHSTLIRTHLDYDE